MFSTSQFAGADVVLLLLITSLSNYMPSAPPATIPMRLLSSVMSKSMKAGPFSGVKNARKNVLYEGGKVERTLEDVHATAFKK